MKNGPERVDVPEGDGKLAEAEHAGESWRLVQQLELVLVAG